MPLGTLIDEEGQVWFAGAPQLRRRFAGGGPDFDLQKHAVCNCGFVLIHERPSSVHLSFRPALVSEPALAAVFYYLAEACPSRVLLTYLLDDWHHEMQRPDEALLRIEDIVATAAQWQPRTHYQEHSHRLGDGSHSALQRWAPLLAVWRLCGGRVPGSLTELFATLNLSDRTIVFRNARASERLLFEHRGTGFSFYQADWSRRLIGRDIEEQPDRAYAAMTARAYRATLGSGEPRFDAVDAVATSPGRDVRRSRYDRLILPWQGSDGTRFLSGVSHLRTSYVLESA